MKETPTGPHARQIDDDMITGPTNVDVLSVYGELQIGQNLKGTCHFLQKRA
jgi:hypothetical protein